MIECIRNIIAFPKSHIYWLVELTAEEETRCLQFTLHYLTFPTAGGVQLPFSIASFGDKLYLYNDPSALQADQLKLLIKIDSIF